MAYISNIQSNRIEYSLIHKINGLLIIDEPKNWKDDEKQYERTKVYLGAITKFSNNLTFIGNAVDFIKTIYDTYGCEAELYLRKRQRHPKTDHWYNSYIGTLDFATYVYEDEQITIKFNDGGLLKTLKSRDQESVEIEKTESLNEVVIDELTTDICELEGRDIFLQSIFEADNVDTKSVSEHKGFGGKTIEKKTPFPLSITTRSHDIINAPNYAPNEAGEDDGDSSQIMFITDVDRERFIDAKFDLSFKPTRLKFDSPRENSRIELRLVRYENGFLFDEKSVEVIESLNQDQQYNLTFERELHLLEGESVSLHFYTTSKLGSALYTGHYSWNYENCTGSVTLEEDSFFEKSSTKIIRAYPLGHRLVELMTGQSDVFHSDVLGSIDDGYLENGEFSNWGFAHGHWIRGFDADDTSEENRYKAFKTSFKDYTGFLKLLGLGVGVETIKGKEKIVVKKMADFYPRITTIKLPNIVNDLKISFDKDNTFSSLTFGAEKGWENEEAMGLDEPNAKSSYSTNIESQKKDYSITTKYITSSYAKEFVRRKPKSDYGTTDHNFDSDIFPIAIKKESGYYVERKWEDDFETSPTGIYRPDNATNLELSPMNILLKHAPFFGSGLTKYGSKSVKHLSSEGNSNLTTQLIGSNAYSETQSILNSNLPRALYTSETLEFSHVMSYELLEQINGTTLYNGVEVPNLYGLIEFTTDKDETFIGYFETLKPNGKGEWKIIKANR